MQLKKQIKMYIKKCISFILAALILSIAAYAQPAEILNAVELQIALEKLNTLGSVLYLAAHPDDENSAVLAYLSKGRKYRTGYLSLTRGDGGQNLIGSEKGAEIGIIRTQELLAARKIDGVEQFFTRAIDFGYSKTSEETLGLWDKEAILSDVVRVIRTFRPDVIITRFPPDGSGGHGHHTASVMLAKEAFTAAADPTRFTDQLKYLQPWKTTRMFWNTFRPGSQEREQLNKVDVGEYNPLIGASYSEIAALSRSMHKTQGFGASGRRGTRYEYFSLIAGESAADDIFDGIDTTWNRIPFGKSVRTTINGILSSFQPQNPSRSLPKLLALYTDLSRFDSNYWVEIKQRELLHIIRSCAGIWMEAITDDYAAAPGDEIRVRTTLVHRSYYPFTIEKISFPEASCDSLMHIALNNNDQVTIDKTLRIPEDISLSQPYWLEEPSSQGRFSIPDQTNIGLAENTPSISAVVTLSSNGQSFQYTLPLQFRWTDRVIGELYRPFEIRPKVTVDLQNKVSIFTGDSPKEIQVKLKSHFSNVNGKVCLKGTENWRIEPAEIPFSLSGKYEEIQLGFTVIPPRFSDQTFLVAEVEIQGKSSDRALVEISHPHIIRQVYFPHSRIKVVKPEIIIPNGTIGYITGAGDEIPDCLQSLGYEVILLDDEMLEAIDFKQFDAVITGIRAYNTRERLKHIHPKLMQYVENGGTVIVQYNVTYGLLSKDIGPYPFTIGRDRISVETAPVTFLNPEHQLLTFPNKISQKDFEGWVQERGLYFASQWDEKYEPILSGHDPNETNKNGGMLFTRYGKGVFIYTGYSWFRQLPAGVTGAYRLYVNMISAGEFNGE